MKKFTALVRENRNGNALHITSEYNTKQNFNNDLKGNGYRIITILSDKEVNEIKEMNHSDFILNKYTNLSVRTQELIWDYVTQVL